MKNFFSLLVIILLGFILVSCGGNEQKPTPTPTPPPVDNGDNNGSGNENNGNGNENNGNENNGNENGEEELKTINATLSNLTVTYNGEEHEILVNEDLPEGVSVTYTNNVKTDAGVYDVTATLNGSGYKTKTLNAILTINKAIITGDFTFNSKTVEYDAKSHSLELIGNIPFGATVTYLYNNEELTSASEVGVYDVVAIIGSKNHIEKRLEATLTIKSTEETLYSLRLGNNIYFQNNLDGNKLYVFNNNDISKVNNHTPEHLITDGNLIYYYNKGLFSKNITSFDGSTTTNLIPSKGEYLTTDGTYLYYAINNLVLNTSQNGIYKVKIADVEDIVKLTSDKAKYLTYHNNTIYYANASEGDKLYKITTSANNSKGTLVWDEKVEYLTNDNNNLYFNSKKLLAAAIYKYNFVSSETIKLTTDSGKYLTVVGNDLYYINNDKITSAIFGDGIYKVSINKNSDSSLPGVKVLEANNNGYSSLTSDGENLYYYKLNDKHFYKYNISSETETDLMKTFTPDNTVNLTGFVDIKEYNNEIYYIDPTDGGSLYKYNPVSKQKIKILADNVSNFYFHEDYLYYSTYIFVNYALFKLHLESFEVTKISSDRHDHLIFKDDLIYYVKVGSIYNNYLYSMNLDGTNKTLLSNADNLWVKSLFMDGNTFYYTRNPKIFAENLSSYTIGDNKPVDFGINARILELHENNIYYYNHKDKNIGVVTKDNQNNQTIITGVEVNSMLVANDKLYYSTTNKTNYGLYAYDLTTKQTTKISDNVGDALTFIDGKLYFMQLALGYTNDYPNHKVSDVNGKLYYYDGTTVKEA